MSMDGEGHTLTATPGSGVEIASRKKKVSEKAELLISKLKSKKKADPQKEDKIATLTKIVKSAKKVESLTEEAEEQKGKKAKKLLEYPGFPAAFRDLKNRIVNYGTEFDAKDLTENDLLDREKLEKEIRDDIIAVARRHDKEGPTRT